MQKYIRTILLTLLVSAGSLSAKSDCDFETDLCGWKVDSSDYRVEWKRGSRGNPGYGTGPRTDASQSASGHFMNVKVPTRKIDAKVSLKSPKLPSSATSNNCQLQFSYSIYAPYQTYCVNKMGDKACNGWASRKNLLCHDKRYISTFTKKSCAKLCGFFCGQLAVSVSNSAISKGDEIYRKEYSQTQYWTSDKTNIPDKYTGKDLWITIEAQTGWDSSSYIAVDNIKFTGCNFQVITTTPTTTTTPSTTTTTPTTTIDPNGIQQDMYDCSFGSDLCRWSDHSKQSFNWKRKTGGDPSIGTGPGKDADKSQTGGYVVMTIDQGQKVEDGLLVSPLIDQFRPSPKCRLHFQYNSYASSFYYCSDKQSSCSNYGNDEKTCNAYKSFFETNCAKHCGFKCANLRVYVTDNLKKLGTPTLVSRSPKDTNWYSHDLDISIHTQKVNFYVVFEGKSGLDSPSYVAIDNIRFVNCEMRTVARSQTTTTEMYTTSTGWILSTQTSIEKNTREGKRRAVTTSAALPMFNTTAAEMTAAATTTDTLGKISTPTYNRTAETQFPQTDHAISSLISTISTPTPCAETKTADVYCPSDISVFLSASNNHINLSIPQPYADKILKCVSCPPSVQTLNVGDHTMRFVYADVQSNTTVECSYIIHINASTSPLCQNRTTSIDLNRDQTQTDAITVENTGVKIRLTAGVHEIQITDRCYHQYVVNNWSNIERHAVIQAEYKVECKKLNKASYNIIQASLLQNTLSLQKHCTGCKLDGSVPHFSCSNQTLIVTWNSGVTGDQRVSESTLYDSLQSDLTQFQKRPSLLPITVIETIPRIVYPAYDTSGLFLKVVVTTSCLDQGLIYNHASGQCEKYCSTDI